MAYKIEMLIHATFLWHDRYFNLRITKKKCLIVQKTVGCNCFFWRKFATWKNIERIYPIHFTTIARIMVIYEHGEILEYYPDCTIYKQNCFKHQT